MLEVFEPYLFQWLFVALGIKSRVLKAIEDLAIFCLSALIFYHCRFYSLCSSHYGLIVPQTQEHFDLRIFPCFPLCLGNSLAPSELPLSIPCTEMSLPTIPQKHVAPVPTLVTIPFSTLYFPIELGPTSHNVTPLSVPPLSRM